VTLVPAELWELTDTVVAVTGASAGIGAATVRLLVQAGNCVAVQARRKEHLDDLVAELGRSGCTRSAVTSATRLRPPSSSPPR
jgi:NADP-dependent 3-hydroxy acid dehydrogenase YdfG